MLFTYLHLAAYPAVAEALLAAGHAPRRVRDGAARRRRAPAAGADERGRRPPGHRRSAPTSSNGTTADAACCWAARPAFGRREVVVLGAGNVGWNAAWIAAGMEAEVVLLDKNLDRLRWVDQIHQGRIMTLASNRGAVERAVADADLVIGAVLVAGGRAPVVVAEDMVRADEAAVGDRRRRGRPGRLHRDAPARPRTTTRSTSLHGVVHYAVGNMPGAVPHTSTYALTNATLPYQLDVALHGAIGAARRDPSIAHGLNTVGGEHANRAVAESLGATAVDALA